MPQNEIANTSETVARTVASPRAPLNMRSFALGTAAVVMICGFTPYNDYVVNNTFAVGNFLPPAVMLVLLVLTIVINVPLRRFRPRSALSTGEISIILAMMLVSCTLPSSGLMRYLPASIVGILDQAGAAPDLRAVLEGAGLPTWLFPATNAPTLESSANSPIVTDFVNRVPGTAPDFYSRAAAVPWRAWLIPALCWGAFFAALFAAIICMSAIVQRQWLENERLPFPLIGLYRSLIEEPTPGRLLNPTLSSRPFWAGCFGVMFLHALGGLNLYFPSVVPAVPLSFDLGGFMSDPPWSYTEWYVQRSKVYFTIVGIVYFIQPQLSFSLWSFLLGFQVLLVMMRGRQVEFTGGMESDQLLGATLMFAGGLFWLGRRQWAAVARAMFNRTCSDDQSSFLAPSTAGWGLLISLCAMIAWFLLSGLSVLGAFVLTAMLMITYVAVARVVAETGMVLVQFTSLTPTRPWLYLLNDLPGGYRAPARDFFFSSWMYHLLIRDQRESASVFISHAAVAAGNDPRSRRKLVWLIAYTLFIGFIIAGAATLYVEYSHATTLDARQDTPLNRFGIYDVPNYILTEASSFVPPRRGGDERHNRMVHFGIGVIVMVCLVASRTKWPALPFHPIGFLLLYSYPLRMIWFSVLIGWICKTLVLRIGGAQGHMQARPLFVGLIVGESAAAVLFLLATLVLKVAGVPHIPHQLLPG